MALLAVLAVYRAALVSRGLVEFADVVRDARHALASCAVAPPYSAVLSDEVQDLGPPIAPESICVAVRTNDLRKTWSEQLTRRSLTVAILKEDEAPGPGVRLATMHRMKGLEFERVILASVQAGTLPQPFAGQSQADDTSRAQHIQSERCLLYVAATRARDELIITGHGAASPLLPARERPDGPGHRAP